MVYGAELYRICIYQLALYIYIYKYIPTAHVYQNSVHDYVKISSISSKPRYLDLTWLK